MSKKDPINFRVASFTTNNNSYPPLTIITKFLSKINDIPPKKIPPDILEFNYLTDIEFFKFPNSIETITKKVKVHIFWGGVTNFQQITEISKVADSFLIFIDLEKNDTYDKMDEIFNFTRVVCDMEKKFL